MTAKIEEGANDLLFEVRDGIGVITFNRPQARNALTFAMYDGLAEICRAAPENPAIKAMVIMGAGGQAFAAGTDVSSFSNVLSAADAMAYERRIDSVLNSIECCSLPVIASLSGACTGGGAAIAAASDLRIASADLKFGFPIAR